MSSSATKDIVLDGDTIRVSLPSADTSSWFSFASFAIEGTVAGSDAKPVKSASGVQCQLRPVEGGGAKLEVTARHKSIDSSVTESVCELSGLEGGPTRYSVQLVGPDKA